MLIIRKNQTNNLIATVSMNKTLANPYYLFSFQHIASKERVSFFPQVITSNIRYDKFRFVEAPTTNLSATPPQVFFEYLGQYYYSIYECITSGSTNPALAYNKLEAGRAWVIVGDDNTQECFFEPYISNDEDFAQVIYVSEEEEACIYPSPTPQPVSPTPTPSITPTTTPTPSATSVCAGCRDGFTISGATFPFNFTYRRCNGTTKGISSLTQVYNVFGDCLSDTGVDFSAPITANTTVVVYNWLGNCCPTTPTPTATPTMTQTPSSTPPVNVLSFTVASGDTMNNACSGLSTGTTFTIYAQDLGNCAPCLPFNCWPCITTGQQFFMDAGLTIPVPDGYYANNYNGTSATWYVLGGFPQPGGFMGCPTP